MCNFKAERLRASLVETNDLFINNYLKNGVGPDVLMPLMACLDANILVILRTNGRF